MHHLKRKSHLESPTAVKQLLSGAAHSTSTVERLSNASRKNLIRFCLLRQPMIQISRLSTSLSYKRTDLKKTTGNRGVDSCGLRLVIKILKGDKNIGYFHSATRARRARNRLSHIEGSNGGSGLWRITYSKCLSYLFQRHIYLFK